MFTEAQSDSVWIDVSMWTGLSGKTQPFTDVQCDPPEDAFGDSAGWRDWALAHLEHVAKNDAWQSGRYHFSVQQRDPAGRPTDTMAHGVWEWSS